MAGHKSVRMDELSFLARSAAGLNFARMGGQREDARNAVDHKFARTDELSTTARSAGGHKSARMEDSGASARSVDSLEPPSTAREGTLADTTLFHCVANKGRKKGSLREGHYRGLASLRLEETSRK